MRYAFHPEAALEHEEQISYYEGRQRGLGGRYHNAMLAAARRVCEGPSRYKIEREPDIRKAALHGFKFNLIYREVGETVQILAVAHFRRKPNYWAARV